MAWTKYGIVASFLVVMFVTSFFCTYFGYTVNGIPEGYQAGESMASFVIESGKFLITMMSFRVDGVGGILPTCFLIMTLIIVLVVISLVRGTD